MSLDERHEVIYKGMSGSRRLVERALKKAITKLYRKHFTGDELVLEVGAGDGFLRNTIPPHSGRWVQLDIYSGRKNLNGPYVQASATALPLSDELFDVVIGFESYNTFKDFESNSGSELEKAVKESVRVLKAGGKFLCFYDLCPNSQPLIEHLEAKGLPTLKVKTSGDGLPIEAVLYIPPNKLEQFRKEEAILYSNPTDPLDTDDELDTDNYAELPNIFRGRKLWEKFGRQIPPQEITRHFNNRLTELLCPHFESVDSGFEFTFYSGKKEDCQQAVNIHGHVDSLWLYRLAILKNAPRLQYPLLRIRLDPNYCLEVVTIPYVVGYKKK